MIERGPVASLGGANHVADYHDPQRMHWGILRVWNDDTIESQTGFPPHSHADMEIITYVREGAWGL